MSAAVEEPVAGPALPASGRDLACSRCLVASSPQSKTFCV